MPRFALKDGRYLRSLEESDAQELYALIDRNRAHLARWMQWAGEQTLERTREFIRSADEQISGNDGFQSAIVAEQRIVGVVGFHGIDWLNRAAGLGYWLDEAHQGRGIMAPAVGVLVGHAFEHWHLNRLEIRADVENDRSRALAERLGFRLEGVLRQAYRVGERYSDDAVYSMLAGERAPLVAGGGISSGASRRPTAPAERSASDSKSRR
jgi:ribosomal-protein-serine acetyltransferase